MPFSKAHLEVGFSQGTHSDGWDARHILRFGRYVSLQIWTTNHRVFFNTYFFYKQGEVAAIMLALQNPYFLVEKEWMLGTNIVF